MNQTSNKKGLYNYVILIIFSLLRFAGDALFYSYAARFYRSLGFSEIQLGILLSIIPFMAVIGNLVLSKIATTFKRNLVIIKIWMLIESIFMGLTGFFTDFYILLGFGICLYFCNNSFYNLFDTFIINITNKAGKNYSSGRIWGTISYIFASFIGGILITQIEYKYTFLIGGICFLISLIIFFFFKFDVEEITKEEQQDITRDVTYKEVFHNRRYVFYLIFIALVLGLHWSSDSVYSLYTTDLGIKDDTFGYFFSAAIVLESVMLMIGSRIKTPKGYRNCVLIGAIALIIRLVVLAIPNLNIYVYLSIEMLRGVTYGMILNGNLNTIRDILGQRKSYKGFFIAIALDELVSAITNLFMPNLIAQTSYTLVFSLLAGFVGIACIFFFLSLPKKNEVTNID